MTKLALAFAPYRISFFGGGTDYPAVMRAHGPGAFLSGTIDLGVRVLARWLPPNFDHAARIVWHEVEAVSDYASIAHPLVRAAHVKYGISRGVEVICMGDAPARSGLGASSAFALALVLALRALTGRAVDSASVVRDARSLEHEVQGEAVGVQDAFASERGGLRLWECTADSHGALLNDKAAPCHPVTIGVLEERLVLVYTGRQRDAAAVAKVQIETLDRQGVAYKALAAQAHEGYDILRRAEGDARALAAIGDMLDAAWRLKKEVAPLASTPEIDALYIRCREVGATGGKLLGAGSGGHFLLYVEPGRREGVVRAALETPGARIVAFHFASRGATILATET